MGVWVTSHAATVYGMDTISAMLNQLGPCSPPPCGPRLLGPVLHTGASGGRGHVLHEPMRNHARVSYWPPSDAWRTSFRQLYSCRTDHAVRRRNGGVLPQRVHAAAAGAVRNGRAARGSWVRALMWAVVCTGVWGLRAWRGLNCHPCHATAQMRAVRGPLWPLGHTLRDPTPGLNHTHVRPAPLSTRAPR